jgi:hypothetical protein
VEFLFLVVLISNQSYGQSIGLRGGLNLSNMLIKDDNETYSEDFKLKPGYQFGAIAEFPISNIFSLETGLLLTTKGYRFTLEETEDGDSYKYTQQLNLLYLDIPLTAKASFNIGNAKIYGLFGPYIGFGLSGKYKEIYEETSDGETESEEEEEKVKWGSDEESDIKRLDYGLVMGAGVEFKSFQLGLNYNLGLANISSYSEDGLKFNNRVIGITVAYKLALK